MATSARERILLDATFFFLCIELFSRQRSAILILWFGSAVKAAARPPHSKRDCGHINSSPLFLQGRGAASTEKLRPAGCGCRRGGRCACAGRKWAAARSLA